MYKISEFSKKLDISSDTVRYYEKIGLLKKPDRSSGGYRLYNESDLKIVHFILRCKQFGFSLTEIKPILKYVSDNEPTSKLKKILDRKIKSIEKKQQELRRLKKQLKIIQQSCLEEDCSLLDYL